MGKAKKQIRKEHAMKVKLNANDLDSNHLSWLCISPMLMAVMGKDLQTKLEMYNRLTEGHKGLFLFYSFHNHAKTIEEFYWFADYNLHELKSWNGIKKGVRYFQDTDMASLLSEIEMFFVHRRAERNKPVSPTDLEENDKLLSDVKMLYEKYVACSNLTISRMNEWIKAHLTDFVEME